MLKTRILVAATSLFLLFGNNEKTHQLALAEEGIPQTAYRINKYQNGQLVSYQEASDYSYGKPKKISEYEISGDKTVLKRKFERTYDSNGNTLYELSIYFDEALQEKYRSEMSFEKDDDGNDTRSYSVTHYPNGEDVYGYNNSNEYIKNSSGLIVEKKFYDDMHDHALITHTYLTYDSANKLQSEMEYTLDSGVELLSRGYIYSYENAQNKNSTKRECYEYTNNDINQPIFIDSYVWTYDDKGRQIGYLEYYDGRYTNREYNFDSLGRNVKMTITSSDDAENWTKTIEETTKYFLNSNNFTEKITISFNTSGEPTYSSIEENEYSCTGALLKHTSSYFDYLNNAKQELYYEEYLYNNFVFHKMIEVTGKEATTEETGFKKAYKCEVCGKYFYEKDDSKEIGDETLYTQWKNNEGKIEKLPNNPNPNDPIPNNPLPNNNDDDGNGNNVQKGLGAGAIIGIVFGSLFLFLLILFIVSYILWKKKDYKLPLIGTVLLPAYRFINSILFKERLNDVELEEEKAKE